MNIPGKFLYYLTVTALTPLISLFIASRFKVVLSESRLAFISKIKSKLVFSLITAYFALFSFLAVLKYNAYNMAKIDLGMMSQAMWNTLRGNLLFCTFSFGNYSRLIVHSEFIYLLIVPFYAIYSDPKLLLLLQAFIVSLGILPVFWIAKHLLKSHFAALCFAAAYFLYPSLQYGTLAEFHADMLATTFLLFTFYYIIRRSWFKYSLFLLLSLMCKEYVSLIAVMLGLYIIFSERKIKIGLSTIVVGIIWFIVTIKIIPLYLKENWFWNEYPFYSHFGSGPIEVIKSILLHPMLLIKKIFSMKAFFNAILILLPLGFISLFHPKTLVLILPIYVGVSVTGSSMFSYANHHNGTIIPFVFISAIFGSVFVIREAKRVFNKDLTNSVAIFVLSCSLCTAFFYGPSPLSWRFWNKPSYGYWGNLHQFKVTKHDKITDKFIKMIPSGVSVSASDHLASHISNRFSNYIFPYPETLTGIDYVLVDILEYFSLFWNPREKQVDALRSLLRGDNFNLTAAQDGVLLFQRGVKKDDRYMVKVDILEKSTPQYIVNESFGNRLSLLGYDFDFNNLRVGSKCRIVYYWQVLSGFNKKFICNYFGSSEELKNNFIVIDKFINGTDEFRVVHLPIYLLHAPNEWKIGEIIKEEFDFYLPQELPLGDYKWDTGFYAVPENFFIETEHNNFVPGTRQIDLGMVKFKKGLF